MTTIQDRQARLQAMLDHPSQGQLHKQLEEALNRDEPELAEWLLNRHAARLLRAVARRRSA